MTRFCELDVTTIPLSGANLIEASAGTGKTFTIAALVLRLILEEGIDIRNLLVVTFTDAATRELRDRIRRNLSLALTVVEDPEHVEASVTRRIVENFLAGSKAADARQTLRRALICFDEASIFTIHGFCGRMLSNHAFESALRFDSELISDQSEFVDDIVDDFYRLTFSRAPLVVCALAAEIGLSRSGLSSLADKLLLKPTLRLVPGPVSGTEAESAENLGRAWQDMRRVWQEESPEIRKILHEHDGLSRGKNSFRADVLDGYLAVLTAMFDTVPEPEGLALIMKYFTPAGLEAQLKPSASDRGAPAHRFFDLCGIFTEAVQDFGVFTRHRFKDYLDRELADRKRVARVQYFSDLLSDLRQALAATPGERLERAIRDSYQAVLIDEFQDTDPVQYEIFSRLFHTGDQRLFLIGDPKQSIYGFRSADIFAYLRAAARVPEGHKYTLAENWRSETSLVRAVNHLFSKVTNPFVLGDTIPFTPVRAAAAGAGNSAPLNEDGKSAAGLVLWNLDGSSAGTGGGDISKGSARDTAITAVTAEIARLLEASGRGRVMLGQRPLTASDLAVLVIRNEEAGLIRERLSALGIPAVVSGSGDVFQTPELEDLERVLRAVAAPGNTRLLNTALITPMIGCPADALQRFLEAGEGVPAESGGASGPGDGRNDYERHLNRFATYHELWHRQGFPRMFRQFTADYQVSRRLLGLAGGERRLTNLMQLVELVQQAIAENHFDMGGLLTWLADRRQAAGREKEETQLRLERDGQAVQIVTVWKSKGLQFPVVFCPFMWQPGAGVKGNEGVLFHESEALLLDIGPECRRHRAAAEGENLAELMRLLYVALTRAVNRCYLICGKIGKPAATAVNYLFTGGLPAVDRNALEPDTPDTDDVAGRLKDIVKSMDEAGFYQAVTDHVRDAGDDIQLIRCRPDQADITYRHAVDSGQPGELQPAVFSGAGPDHGWALSSFTHLIYRRTPVFDIEDSGPGAFPVRPDDIIHSPPEGIFAFPAGAVPGLSIHAIFEELDFTDRDGDRLRRLVHEMLGRYGLENRPLSESAWTDTVCAMVNHVRQTPLLPEDPAFRLERVPAGQKIAEMSFFYPIRHLTVNGLRRTLRDFGEAGLVTVPECIERLGRLDFNPIHGYMRGFIDLILFYQGRYFLLDWKTNHLGNGYDCYGQAPLRQSMAESGYCLQYYIYCVALQRYLRNRLADYDYNNHFGGVFYLFVRGMHPDRPGSGVYFDRPSRALVDGLEEVLG